MERQVVMNTLREVTDTAREMSLIVCTSCWMFREEKEYKVPKLLRTRHNGNKNYDYRMLGGWYAKCEECRDGD